MRRTGAEQGTAPTMRRRERLQPARAYVMQIRMSFEERDQILAGAAAAGMTAGGFTARAALDASVACVVPAGARTTLERLAGFQLELAGLRRRLDTLRATLASQTADPALPVGGDGDVLRHCAEAAHELTNLSGLIHRLLEAGSAKC